MGAGLLALAAATALGWQSATSRWIDLNGYCGFDGSAYCQMAAGRLVAEPFSRRPVAPLLVRAIPAGSVIHRFMAVDVVSIAVAAGLLFVLTRRVARELCSDPRRSNAGGVVAASLLVLNPWVWHAAMTYPALTDPLSLALGLGWLVALVGNRPWMSLALAGPTVLCREAWAPPMLLALVVCWFLMSDHRPVWVANAALVIEASALALNLPRLQVPGPSYTTVANTQIQEHFATFQGFARFSWMAAAGLGFVALLGVVLMPVAWRRGAGARALIGVVLALAAGHVVMAVLGGSDMDRLLVPAAALLTAVTVGTVARFRTLDAAAAVAVLASLIVWQPWRRVPADPKLWLNTFGIHAISWNEMRAKLIEDLQLLLLLVLTVAAIVGVAVARKHVPLRSLARPRPSR